MTKELFFDGPSAEALAGVAEVLRRRGLLVPAGPEPSAVADAEEIAALKEQLSRMEGGDPIEPSPPDPAKSWLLMAYADVDEPDVDDPWADYAAIAQEHGVYGEFVRKPG